MEELRDSFSKLVEETLTMEDPRRAISQSQQQYDSGNEEDNKAMTTENLTEEVLEKANISLSKLKIRLWTDIRLGTLPHG